MKSAIKNLWMRSLAFGLDYFVITGYLIILIALSRIFSQETSSQLFSNPLQGQLIGFLTVTLPVSLYFALNESSSRQATWGKRKIGLMVLTTTGRCLSKARSLARTALKFIPWELAHVCIWQITANPNSTPPLVYAGLTLVWVLVFANIMSLFLSKSRQTIYDRLTNTVVSDATL